MSERKVNMYSALASSSWNCSGGIEGQSQPFAAITVQFIPTRDEVDNEDVAVTVMK